MTNSATYFKWAVILVIAIAILWLLRQSGCVGGNKSTNDTVSVRIDTTYINTRDTVYVETLVPYKVEYVKDRVLHDTLEKFEFQHVDTARILAQYFAKRFYADTQSVRYGYVLVNDTVTQNRITGRSIILNQNIPVVKETVTLTQPKRVIVFFGIQALGNQKNLPYASGVTLDMKLKNDGMIGFGGYLTRDQPMYSASLKFPIHLRKH